MAAFPNVSSGRFVTRLAFWLAFPLLLEARPNLVIILADDLGWNDVGYHGSEIDTPHIDALVAQGLELDRYYAFPVCSPTRAALLTGRSPLRIGVSTPIGATGHLPLDEHLLPETLRAAGYQTFLAGKWHLGIERVAAHPYRRGFDRSYGHLGPSVDYFSHVWEGGLDWHRDGQVRREDGYTTTLITDEAVRLIEERDTAAPMFLYVAFNAPHTPLQAPDEYVRRYAHIEDRDRRVYAAMVSALDDGVGRIVDALDAAGIARDTLLLWASDNGGGRNVGASNHPLRGGKGNAFEGGIRVPAVIRWPGVLPEGRSFDQMITAQDWFPTLASAAGIEPRNDEPFDGLDMWSALRDGDRVERGETAIGATGNFAVFHSGWKFVQFSRRATDQIDTHLFRIADDPLEQRDLIAAEPERAQRLLDWMRSFPQAPAVSSFRPPNAGRRGGQGRGPRARAAGGRQGPGRRTETPSLPDGPPWIERAKRD